MTDFASLVLAVDSTQVKTGTASLDGLAAAGARAEAATIGLGAGAKSASVQAAALAASAQASARAAVGQAAGFGAVTNAVHGNTIAMRESLVVGRELLNGNLTRLPGSLSILAQQFAISGKGASGFASQIMQSIGIIKTVTDAELAGEAAAAAAAASAVESIAARAQANVLAADTEVALAQAAIKTAATTEALTAAQAQLAAAHEAVAAAAGEATTAEVALADANAAAAETAKASSGASVTRLTGFGTVLVSVAAAAALAEGAFKAFQAEVSDSGVLDRYAHSLGLTEKQIKSLKDVTITWKDVALGVWDTIADNTGAKQGLDGLKKYFISTFEDLLKTAVDTYAEIYGVIAGTYRAVIVIWNNFPAALGDVFVQGVNAAIGALNKLIQASITGVNGFLDKVNSVLPEKLQISHLAGVQIDQITNQYAGAAKKVAGALKTEIDKATAEGRAQAKGVVDDLEKNIIGEAEKRIKNEEDANAKRAKKVSDHGLAEALAQLDAQIEGQNRLAAAYQVSDAAAIKAEALQKAEEQAIRHKGEIGIFYEKELALAVATRAAEGAKTIADLRFEADSRAAVNGQVEAGIIPASQAARALELETKLRPLTAAAAVAEGDAKTRLVDIIRNLTKAYGDNNAEIAREAALREIASKTDVTAKLEREISLIGASNKVRAEQLAILEAEQFIKNNDIADPKTADAVKQAYLDAADATVGLQQAQDKYNASLSYMSDLLSLIDQQAQQTASTLSDAFGSVGAGIGQALTALTTYGAAQAKLDQQHAAAVRAGISDQKEQTLYATASANAQLQAIGGVIGGLKGLFSTHSAGYRVMEGVEKAFAIAQLVRTIASIGPKIAAGAATMFSELGPFAFPAVAAMLAVMAGLGFSGGSSTQKAPDIPTSGTGTVLGDSTAQSNSIADSLDIMAKNSTRGLDYTLDMVRSLRKIESGIGSLAANVARQLSLSGGFFDTTGKTGTNSSGGLFGGIPIFGIIGSLLFGGSTTTKTLFDEGIKINAATVASIIANGITGATYQVIESVKKTSGFLGIGGGTKTSYKTTTGALDADFARQAQLVIGNIFNSVVDAAKVLGLDVANTLKTFKVEIGQISFKDLKGDEITKALEGVFSKVADQMAGFAVSGLEQFQKTGEGLFETLTRLATDYLTVDAALKSIGLTFGSVGVASVAARENLIDLMGGIDKFTDQINFYFDNFLSQAEQTAFLQSEIDAQFAKLGVAEPQSIAQFKSLVAGIDLTTDAGQALFAALMAIAPAFSKVIGYFDDLNKKAISGFQQTISQFTKFADSLKQYRATLFATDAAQGNAYATLKAKFAATAALAATGDATALGGLQGAGQDFLTAARNNASSMQQYLRDVAQVARGVDQGIFAATATADYAQLQLDALQNATAILGTIATNTATTAAALTGVPGSPALAAPLSPPAAARTGSASTTSNADLIAEIEALRADLNAALQAIATTSASTDKTLKRWDRGDSAAISADSDTPLNTNLKSWG